MLRMKSRPTSTRRDPIPERLRQVAQALQGKALREQGESKPAEAQACERLLGAWGRLVEDNLLRSRP